MICINRWCYATTLEIMFMEERGAFYPVPTQPFFCSPLLQCAPPYIQISGIVYLEVPCIAVHWQFAI